MATAIRCATAPAGAAAAAAAPRGRVAAAAAPPRVALAARRGSPAVVRGSIAARVSSAGRPAQGSTVNPFGDDCVERTETEAYQSVAMAYFAMVGEAEPCLQSVMEDSCVMTDRVLEWCFRGREAVEGHFRDFHDKYCSHEFSHLDVLTNIKHRTVCAHWALTVVPRNNSDQCDVPGAATLRGQTMQITGVHLFTLNADNKISDIVTYRTSCNGDDQFNY